MSHRHAAVRSVGLPELDVPSCGHDVEEARRNLKTAVRLFVEEAEKLGTLDEILRG